MTCGLAVKRPHDYEAYLGTDGGVDAKRPRTTSAHCSPFRPQLGTLAASLPHSNTLNLLREKVSLFTVWRVNPPVTVYYFLMTNLNLYLLL